jgi:hypothetical protein
MRNKNGKMSSSAAANGDDNFEAIPFGQNDFRVTTARNDFAVAFDRDTLAGVTERFDQGQHRKTIRELTGFAIE